MEKLREVRFMSIPLICKGIYTEAEPETIDEPSYPASFETFEVYVQDSGYNIIDIFSEDDLITIDLKIIEEWHN